MATRTALLNGNVINRDTDFSKYIEAVSEPGVIEGLTVSSTSVAIGKAFVKCERTNGDVIYAIVYNNSAQSISGNGDVYIEIPQELIDNGELAPEDGSSIAEIKVGTMPSKNALKLATKNGSTITDERNIIKKVGELNTLIETSNTDIEDLDERVEALEEAGAIDHLEESGLVGELYTLNDTLFKQYTPTLENSTLDCNVSNTSANKQIHIQRIGSGVASNQLKLKVKMVGSSTQNLIVEVRKGVQVNVSSTEAYWYGDEVIATGSIAYSNITNTYGEFTITLNNEFGGTEGELLDIVVYQTGSIVNASNYYCIACDSTQYSEAFSYVSVNGTTRTRSYLMPYCISDGFAQSLLVKVEDTTKSASISFLSSTNSYYRSSSSSSFTIVEDTDRVSGDVSAEAVVSLTCKVIQPNVQGTCGVRVRDVTSGVQLGGQVSWNYNDSSYHNVSIPITYIKGHEITVKYVVNDGAKRAGTIDRTTYITLTLSPLLYKGLNAIREYPKHIESIGSTAQFVLYGVSDIDATFKNGVFIDKEIEAITGDIAPGNFVGYIKVNFNGEIIKIPYYN